MVYYFVCLTIGLPDESTNQVLEWASKYSEGEENMYLACEGKFQAMEQVAEDNKKRIKDLESQRLRLEKDLEIRTEKVMQQQLEIEIIRTTPESQDATQLMNGREQYQMKSLQVFFVIVS